MGKDPQGPQPLNECPVCSSPDITFFKESSFDPSRFSELDIKITDSGYGRTWRLSRCRNCTHVFADPSPPPSFIRALYSRVEDPGYEEEARGRGKNFRRILSRLEKLGCRKGRLLDVGAATGILVHLARQRGWKAEGIEPSAWAVRRARDTYGLSLIENSFEAAEFEHDAYSAVAMIDFIEHNPNPRECVERAFRLLSPGGILCLVTPDIASLVARWAGQRWWHFRPGHLAYFTSKSLDVLLDRAGFQVLKKKKYIWTFSAHYLISRMPALRLFVKNSLMALFWKKIPIKLALADSMEIYAEKRI